MVSRMTRMDAVNHRAYSARRAVRAYTSEHELFPAEQQILGQLRPFLKGKRVLDIGVGGGRTTPFLLDLTRDYFAIDYSDRLVQATRQRFNIDSIYCCDARDMSLFPDEHFDFVLFSFNGIDYMPHDGRLRALTEIRRVLRPGAHFLFSSHNRNCTAGPKAPELTPGLKAKETVKSILTAHRRWWLRQGEFETEEYAIVNDGGLRCSLLTYYISPRCQLQQLQQCGFRIENLYDLRGAVATGQDISPWVHYLVRKDGASV